MKDKTERLPITVCDSGRTEQLAVDIANRKRSPVELLQHYLDRIDAVDDDVKAWREVDRDRAMKHARQLEEDADKGQIHGPLHGIPIGVKDIIDVAGIPTRCNSSSRINSPAATADAEVVLQLKTHGAVVLGKVHTTEFAYFDVSPACNPWNTEHTPGGSSSGSGAAVGAGMVPLALGTQTIASVNRPAAYCGISAFKPSSGSLSTNGVAPLAASYDTIGFYGGRVTDAVYAFEAAAPSFVRSAIETARMSGIKDWPIKIVLVDDALIGDAEPDMAQAYRKMADALANAGHHVEQRKSNIDFDQFRELQRSTTFYEAGHTNAEFLNLEPGQLGDNILAMVREGLSMSDDQYFTERREIDRQRGMFLRANQDADVFLWPAAPGAAPHGLESTGDPRYIGPWTGIGGPMVTIPAGLASNRMPLGCIVNGHPGADAQMCYWAREIAKIAEESPFDV